MSNDKKIKPVEIVFSQKWYNRHLGVDFSEDAWTDPIKRTELYREIERVMYERFGDVGIGSKDPVPNPTIEAYGHRFMPALYGCEIKYYKDQAPCALHLKTDMEEMGKIIVPDFDGSHVVKRALAEANSLEKHYGYCKGNINTGSSLNAAVSIFGDEFLTACAIEPEIAQHVLMVIAKTLLKLYRDLSAKIEPKAFPESYISMFYGNCPAIMFSPKMYREVILPVDKWFRSQVDGFFLHHCGVFDKYIDLYTELNPTKLEIGGGSDYKAIRKAFPDIPYTLIINAPDVEGKTTSDIDELVGNMIEGAGPTDKISSLWVSDLNETTSDDIVRALRTVNERI